MSASTKNSLQEQWLQLALGVLPNLAERKKKGTPILLGPIELNGISLALACAARAYPQRLWITGATARHREQLIAELQFWGVPCLTLTKPSDPASSEEGTAPQNKEKNLIDPEATAEFLTALRSLSLDHSKNLRVIFTDPETFAAEVPDPNRLGASIRRLKVGEVIDPDTLLREFAEAGFERESSVFGRCQFARRGGIVDVFPFQGKYPLRIEFFDEEIESLRFIDLDTQGSIERVEKAELLLSPGESDKPLHAWMEEGDLRVAWDSGQQDTRQPLDEITADLFLTDEPTTGSESASSSAKGAELSILRGPFGAFDAGDFVVAERKQELVFAQFLDWKKDGWTVGIASGSEGEWERFRELADAHKTDLSGFPHLSAKGSNGCPLSRSIIMPTARLAIVSLTELFGRSHTHLRTASASTRLEEQRLSLIQNRQQINEWDEGDLVVHAEYGVGRFLGIDRDSTEDEEHLTVEYANGASLSVPIDQSHLLARYIGMGGRTPDLQTLGSGKWAKAKAIAEEAIMDYAAQLLKIQAQRTSEDGLPHPADTHWMREFEDSFPFTETPDQGKAIIDAKADLESITPMDRLICGDVGFGKTEVAIRAAFKVATGGRQVLMLVPTTVLAEQHYRTFRERMSDFPVRIELLSRFQKPAKSRETVRELAEGSVDIVIGTHRLLSKDIIVKNIGLVIIDEEQRFGVKHKEEFKKRFANIDILTLSATPIPRTLYLSLMGARDMSTIDTPPRNRHPVQTSVCAYDERLIRSAIQREMKRGGQTFFLHNRVGTIDQMKAKIQDLVPEARILVGHGQMDQHDLEKIMHAFIAGEADVLLATTIIESGIDIPNANTILIDRADRFGLADLYQLRGRVGRSGQRAYAILLLPPDFVTAGPARKRLNAIHQYTALGSGFKIAMRDLEIRGAGNLLGTKQSGHIAAIGFDLYCQLLRQSVEQLKSNQSADHLQRHDSLFRADFIAFSESDHHRRKASKQKDILPAYLPAAYIDDPKERVAAYRELATISNRHELTNLSSHWRDRYGRQPTAVKNLLNTRRLRLAAGQAGIESVEIKERRLMLKRNGSHITLLGNKYPRLTATKSNKKLTEAVQWIEKI